MRAKALTISGQGKACQSPPVQLTASQIAQVTTAEPTKPMNAPRRSSRHLSSARFWRSADDAATSGTRRRDEQQRPVRHQVGDQRRQLAERPRLQGRRGALVVLLAVQPAVGERLGQQAVDDIAVGVGGAQGSHGGVARVVLEGRPQVT